jgi:aryl-alcohol dehydrogenase-like predicted oxidoreductase
LDQAKAILNAVPDFGISLIDTSPDFGGLGELIGEFISGRRTSSEFRRSLHRPVDDFAQARSWK